MPKRTTKAALYFGGYKVGCEACAEKILNHVTHGLANVSLRAITLVQFTDCEHDETAENPSQPTQTAFFNSTPKPEAADTPPPPLPDLLRWANIKATP